MTRSGKMQTVYTKKKKGSSTRYTGKMQPKMEYCVQLSSPLEDVKSLKRLWDRQTVESQKKALQSRKESPACHLFAIRQKILSHKILTVIFFYLKRWLEIPKSRLDINDKSSLGTVHSALGDKDRCELFSSVFNLFHKNVH